MQTGKMTIDNDYLVDIINLMVQEKTNASIWRVWRVFPDLNINQLLALRDGASFYIEDSQLTITNY